MCAEADIPPEFPPLALSLVVLVEEGLNVPLVIIHFSLLSHLAVHHDNAINFAREAVYEVFGPAVGRPRQ